MYRQSEKKLLSSNIASICPHNMVNFVPLAAEIVSLVWGTPGNFNGFRVLAALMHGTLVVGVSQTAALNRGRHLYSAGRPSRWAFAHISSCGYFLLSSSFFRPWHGCQVLRRDACLACLSVASHISKAAVQLKLREIFCACKAYTCGCGSVI